MQGRCSKLNLMASDEVSTHPGSESPARQQSRRSGEGSLRRSGASMLEPMAHLLRDLAFWVLLVAAVFGACYWIGSQMAVLLIASHWLRAERALVFALASGALMTLAVLLGLSSLFKRKR